MNNRFYFRVWTGTQMLSDAAVCHGVYVTADWSEYIDFILMQCTGLKDKNGKLIYEGDILQQSQLPHKVVCEWYKDGFWLNGFMNGAKRELRNMHNWYEIIGNIYENKELLESEG